MHISDRVWPSLAALTLVASAAHLAGAPAAAPAKVRTDAAPLLRNGKTADGAFPLTVDSIMRGPKLVGYPPTGLRWSGDSARLYFEWRRPGEDEASTWVVNRDGSGLKKLSDEERRSVPAVNAVWDKAHRRALFV